MRSTRMVRLRRKWSIFVFTITNFCLLWVTLKSKVYGILDKKTRKLAIGQSNLLVSTYVVCEMIICDAPAS